MKTLLYMAISANGCIADHKENTPWSDAEWKNFKRIVKSCGNIIIGRRTFEQMASADGFAGLGIKRTRIIAVSRTYKPINICGSNIAKTPQRALALVKHMGCKTALIAGGTKLNSSFLSQNLVDEMMLDVEPFLFGGGMPLVEAKPFVHNLKLLAVKKYRGGVNLHYKILRTK